MVSVFNLFVFNFVYLFPSFGILNFRFVFVFCFPLKAIFRLT